MFLGMGYTNSGDDWGMVYFCYTHSRTDMTNFKKDIFVYVFFAYTSSKRRFIPFGYIKIATENGPVIFDTDARMKSI